MQRRSWWWMAAVAGVVALALPAARSMAQDPPTAGDEDAVEDEIEDSLGEYGWFEEHAGGPGGPGGPGGGGGFAMRHGPGGGHGGMGRGMGHGGGHGMGMGRGGGMGGHMRMMLGALDLTADQKKKVADIHDREARRNIQARADMQVARLDLRKLMHAESPDRRAIEAQIDKLGAMRSAQQKSHVGVMFEVRGLLTDAQKKKLQELQDAGPGMHGRGGPGMGQLRERIHQPERPDDAQ